MAEVVHRNLEAMLPQLEELESCGIFSHEEIRAVIKFRRNHEYSMVRRPAHKEDFLAAIKYELHLDLLRKHRKKRLRITGSRKDADYGIQNRIHGLFRRVLRKFKGDLKLWLQYIEFAEKSHHKISLSRIFGRALAIHPNSIKLWIMAAKFQFEELKDPASARSLLHQGLRANKTSQHLWLEYFRMELMHTDKVRKRKATLGLEEGDVEEKVSDEFLSYKVALVAFHQAIKAIPGDVKFRLAFLPICQVFADTASLQDEVYDSLRKDFSTHPLVWGALARRPWLGLDTAALKACQVQELESQSELMFEEGLTTVSLGCVAGPASNVASVWECFFDWSMERFQEVSSFKTVRKKAKERLLTSFAEACKDGRLNVQTYEQYVRMLQSLEQHEEALSAVTFALRIHPSSVSLWLLRLAMVGVAVRRKGEGQLGKQCRLALEQVSSKDSLPIWQLWLEKLMAQYDDEAIEDVFKYGMSSGRSEVAEALGVLYLEWAFAVGGLSKARGIYTKLLESFPVPYSLYGKCLELEEQALACSPGVVGMGKLREMCERALRDYGVTRVDLWLKCICVELHHSERCVELYHGDGCVERVSKLHWRAVKALQPSLTAEFMEKYSLLHLTDTRDSQL